MKDLFADQASSVLVRMTTNIVAAYVANHVVPASGLAKLIFDIHAALLSTETPSSAPIVLAAPKPAVSIRKSVQTDHISCLECGGDFRSLKRHLLTHHGLLPDDYRKKWNLQSDYPMVAPAYAEARSELAKRNGFGKRREFSRKLRRSN